MGNLFVFILGDLLPFRTALWIMLAVPLVHFCILLRLPETPSYLIKCGKNEETTKVLAWLRSLPEDDKAITEEVDRLVGEQTIEPKFSPRLLWNKSAGKNSVARTGLLFPSWLTTVDHCRDSDKNINSAV
ncbi:facilitated trehalose transporter Tret1-like [Hyposmocoma kahamanoa]|uniref:facilitated trehalose transporter Tret1-like n=1 Tax=Hyposmocoma kahamanoa TaxID=1477025 RepID=UPI000E6D7B06|nr:facilitated trehalose transporter Tret1-like [Hyposmocoma kahamanoa]